MPKWGLEHCSPDILSIHLCIARQAVSQDFYDAAEPGEMFHGRHGPPEAQVGLQNSFVCFCFSEGYMYVIYLKNP